MAESLKDIALKIAVSASGADQVDTLAKQLDDLAKKGGDSAPKFKAMADELRALGQQDQAVATLGRLEDEVEQTGASFNEAKNKLAQLRETLEQQSVATQEFRDRQQSAQKAMAETSAELRKAEAEYRLLKASTDDAGKETVKYKAQAQALRLEIAQLRNTQIEQRVAFREAAAETAASERALKQVAGAHREAQKAAGDLGKQYALQNEEMARTKATLGELGVAATRFKDAEQQVSAAEKEVRAQVAATTAEYARQISISEAVAAANERNVALARRAAEERAEAARKAAAAQKVEQQAAEAAALAAKLAAEEKIAAEKKVAEAAKQSGEALQQAFATVGMRSAQQIQSELNNVRAALNAIRDSGALTGKSLAAAMEAGEKQVKQLERELRAANGQLTLMDRAANVLNTTIGKFTAGAVFANVIQNAAYQVTTLGNEALQANINLQKMELGLKSVFGSAEASAKQIEFLRSVAQKAGVSISDISGSYVKFAASAQAANIPLETTNGLFAAVTRSAAALGLSGEKVADMLNALGQMASKGVVQMEELRGQLGDALPGALPKVAKGLGITTAEMEHLAKNGQLLATDVFPALQRVLEQGSVEVNTISAMWARFKNVMTETAQVIGQGAIGQALIGAFAAVAWSVQRVTLGIAVLGEAFTQLGKRIGVAVSDIVNQGVKFRGFSEEAKKAFAEIDAESMTRLNGLRDRIVGVQSAATGSTAAMAKATDAAGKNIELVGDQIVYVSEQVAASSAGVQGNAQAHAAAGEAASANAGSQVKSGEAAAAAGQAVGGATVSWTQLLAAYGKVNEAVEQQVKLAQSSVEAKKAEGEAAQRIAALSENEIQIAQAAAKAAEDNANAQAALTKVRETELGVLRAQLAAETALYNASKTKDDRQREEIEKLSKLVQLKAQDLEKSKETTGALQTEAAARDIASQKLKDNSSRVDELRKAHEAAQAELKAVIELEKQGYASAEDIAKAQRAAAIAAAMYSDALKDQTAAIRANQSLKQASISVEEMGVKLSIEQARTSLEVARARGDERGVMEATNRIRMLEIDLLRLQAQAKRAEAEAGLAVLEAERAELVSKGMMTPALEKELDAREKLIEVKRKQAQIMDEQAGRLIRLSNETNNVGNTSRKAASDIDAMSGSMDRAAGSADRLAGAIQNVKNANRETIGVSSQGGGALTSNGVRKGYDISAEENRLYDFLHGGGKLTEQDRSFLEANLKAAQNNLEMVRSATGMQTGAGIDSAMQKVREAQRALESIGGAGGGSSLNTFVKNAGDQPVKSAAGTNHTVNITLGGQSKTIKTASEEDSQALVGLLKAISTASTRAI